MTLLNKIYDNTLAYLHVFKFPSQQVIEACGKGDYLVMLVPADHVLLPQIVKHVMFTPDDRNILHFLGWFNGVPVITENERSRGRTHNIMLCSYLNRLALDALKELE
jgi:hypothetical protein